MSGTKRVYTTKKNSKFPVSKGRAPAPSTREGSGDTKEEEGEKKRGLRQTDRSIDAIGAPPRNTERFDAKGCRQGRQGVSAAKLRIKLAVALSEFLRAGPPGGPAAKLRIKPAVALSEFLRKPTYGINKARKRLSAGG